MKSRLKGTFDEPIPRKPVLKETESALGGILSKFSSDLHEVLAPHVSRQADLGAGMIAQLKDMNTFKELAAIMGVSHEFVRVRLREDPRVPKVGKEYRVSRAIARAFILAQCRKCQE